MNKVICANYLINIVSPPEQQQQNTNDVFQQAIQAQTTIKEVGFGAIHFR